MKKLFFLLMSFITSNLLFSQNKIGLSSLVPPAPNAAELGKYGTIPVGTLTGVPEISFPLYEVKSGSLSLPIVLSYHASGIQVNQRSTDVGLGWSVMAGGTISRTIYGAADNTTYGYFNYTPPSYNSLLFTYNYYTMATYNVVAGTGYDMEPDLFTYSIGGKSGKFIYKPGQGFATIPFEPIKIEKFGVGQTITFQLTDDNGVIYKFNQYSNTISDFIAQRDHITSWYLTSIISADLTDTIGFEYESVYQTDLMVQQSYPIGKKIKPDMTEAFVSGDDYGLEYRMESNNAYNELLIRKINFKNGYVMFNRNTARKDNPQSTKMLDEIVIYNMMNEGLKKISFNHDYFYATPFANSSAHHRLKLNGFTESDFNLSDKKSYNFEYESTSLPPYGSFNIDYWGLFNGSSNLSLIPQTTVMASEINYVSFANGESYGNGFANPNETWTVGSANREPSETFMKAAILNKIVYPTSGYSLFEYESHRYSSNAIPGSPTTKIGGGLRIKSIRHFTDNGSLAKEEHYEYGLNGNGVGVRLFEEKNFYRNYEDIVYAYYISTLGGSCIPQNTGGSNVKWQRNFLGISKYNTLNYMGSPVLYSRVTKYEGSSTDNIGKIVFIYNVVPDFPYVPDEFINSGNYGSINNAWRQGEIISDTSYRKENNEYVPVTATINEYSLYNQRADSAILFKQHKQFIRLQECGTYSSGPEPSVQIYGQGFFTMYPYLVKSGAVRKTKETRLIFDVTDPTKYSSSVTEYQYQNQANRYLTETKTINSDGSYTISRLKYPQDISNSVTTTMVSRNILTPTLEEKVFKSVQGSESLINYTQTLYRQTGNLITRDSIKSSTRLLPLETRVVFNQYDLSGNILEQQKAEDLKQSYVWDYGAAYPIAEVINSPVSEVAYSSFEADGKGNWSFAGTGIRDYTTPSGKYAYNLADGSISKSISTGNTYTLSYWRPVSLSALTIPGTQNGYPVTGRTVNGWKYYEHKVTGVGSVSLSGTGLIDELRLYPATSQMTSFTYDALVGVKSICDPKNRFTYYEYDGLQRLILVRDQDRSILKKICYNYSGDPETCVLYGNSAQTGSFTRNICPSGYVGSTVSYTVPDSVFYATSQNAANQLAIADLQTNGQAYANRIGTCTISSSCNSSNCTGVNKKCINGICETGIKVYTSSVQIGSHLYECTYHYEWSDGSWSPNYTEQSPTNCTTINEV